MSVASRAILSNFFEEQGTQNYPQYLSGLSRALFPTTFLEIPVSDWSSAKPTSCYKTETVTPAWSRIVAYNFHFLAEKQN